MYGRCLTSHLCFSILLINPIFQKPAQISSFYLFLIEYILGFWYLFSKIIKYQVHNSLNEYFFFYAFSIIQNCSIGTQFNNSITDSMHKYLFNCFIFCCSLFICVIIFVSNLGRHLCILWFSWSNLEIQIGRHLCIHSCKVHTFISIHLFK